MFTASLHSDILSDPVHFILIFIDAVMLLGRKWLRKKNNMYGLGYAIEMVCVTPLTGGCVAGGAGWPDRLGGGGVARQDSGVTESGGVLQHSAADSACCGVDPGRRV